MNKKYSKAQDEDDEEGILLNHSVLGYRVKSVALHDFSFHVNNDIRGPEYYTKIFDLLVESGEHDTITMFIGSYGGRLDGLNILLEGIRMTDAHVRAVILSDCHSAASILALSAHEVIVCDAAEMLVHQCRFGIAPTKVIDVVAQAAHTQKTTEKLTRSVYEGFLTSDEIEEVLKGRELWLDADQIRERLERKSEYLEAKFQAEQALESPPEPKPARKRKTPVEA